MEEKYISWNGIRICHNSVYKKNKLTFFFSFYKAMMNKLSVKLYFSLQAITFGQGQIEEN